MNIKRVLPMEVNLVIKNLKDFIFQKKYEVHRTDEKPISFFLDAATYNNLGDQAISFAIELFLNDRFGKDHVRVINESDLISYIKSLQRQIRCNDIITLSGGGNMGDLYPRYEALRRLVIKSFPNNRIIIFPQTIDYSNTTYGKRELRRAKKIYGNQPKLVVCAREKKSYEVMNKLYSKVVYAPDIVLYLNGRVKLKYISSKNYVGICLRYDKESIISYKDKRAIYSALKEENFKIEELTTMSDFCGLYLNESERQEALVKKIQEFSCYKCIITDRLHGMIFSVLAGIPCLAIDNSNQKVSRVLETIGNSVPVQIIKPDNLSDIPAKIEILIKKSDDINSWKIDRNMYSELEKLLK